VRDIEKSHYSATRYRFSFRRASGSAVGVGYDLLRHGT
jgi:hypothetical protein